MKNLNLALLTLLFAASCAPKGNSDVELILKKYVNFVDSVYSVNDLWKQVPDTFYITTLVDPNDPSKNTLDTVITLPEQKRSILTQNPDQGYLIDEAYKPLFDSVEAYLPKMDDEMKLKYNAAKEKYELLNHS